MAYRTKNLKHNVGYGSVLDSQKLTDPKNDERSERNPLPQDSCLQMKSV